MPHAAKQHIFGWHAVLSALEQTPDRVGRIWIDAGRSGERPQAVIRAAEQARVPTTRATRAELDVLAGTDRHQGVVAECDPIGPHGEQDLDAFLRGLAQPALVLVLDGVQDPHNLGACLRSADAAGAHAVILPRDNAVGITPTVRKVASGGADTVPVFRVTNLVRTLERLKQAGLWIAGAAADAESELYGADLRGPVALVLGAEGKGLRRLTREHCDFLIRIPMAGSVASLNVAAAAAVSLFEALRQRRAAASSDARGYTGPGA
ncbi:MAG: 23S rRNA (guanosine(2251)-2'-O)-methyltransferase RlmB [Gammaproteobacteria bacterium]|nr:23S rRNA (guanosine(2251)-2'-O)-methyltransferase RlmB [Gammaproteobacteria bacterium]